MVVIVGEVVRIEDEIDCEDADNLEDATMMTVLERNGVTRMVTSVDTTTNTCC